MAFKRALWHSGLEYQQVCKTCHKTIRYTDYNLDFRPWFADGFVYCPSCNTPLRHSEQFAINEDGTPYHDPIAPQASEKSQPMPSGDKGFCTNCGKPFVPGVDHFCGNCGKKLD